MREFSARIVSPSEAALIFAALLSAVFLSYFFIDRQLAEALRPNLQDVRPVFVGLTQISTPLTPAASLCVVFVALSSFLRGSLAPSEAKLLRLGCAILVAGIITFQLKMIFGRTWPETWVGHNPSYFGDGTYGFFPFKGFPSRGGLGYTSFPSGHMTAIASLAGALWFLWPALRWIGIALAVLVAVGLLGADHHWLSDVIAGGGLGGTAGVVGARIGAVQKA